MLNPADLIDMDEDQLALTGKLFLDAIVAGGMTEEAMPNLGALFQHAAQAAWAPKPLVAERRDNVITVNFRRS